MGRSSAEILASKSLDELKKGISDADAGLALLDHLEQTEDCNATFERNSKTYENYVTADTQERRRLYTLGKSLCEAEIARRQS